MTTQRRISSGSAVLPLAKGLLYIAPMRSRGFHTLQAIPLLFIVFTAVEQTWAMALQGGAMGHESVTVEQMKDHNSRLADILGRMQPEEETLEQIRKQYLGTEIDMSPPISIFSPRKLRNRLFDLPVLSLDGKAVEKVEAKKTPFRCEEQWTNHPRRRPTIRILYERHDNELSKTARQAAMESARAGESILLLESDFSNLFLQAESIHQSQYSYQRGVERTVKQHGQATGIRGNIRGVDHALFRAFASLSYWREMGPVSREQILEELVRNDHLRASVYSVSVAPSVSSSGKGLAKCFIESLNRMENATNPKLDESFYCSKIDGVSDLVLSLEKDLKEKHPLLGKLPYEITQFQLRDAAMASATLDAVCDAMEAGIKDVFLNIGYLHNSAIQEKLRAYVGAESIIETNTTIANRDGGPSLVPGAMK